MREPFSYPGVGRFAPLRVEGPVYSCADIHGRLDLMDEFIAWTRRDRRRGEAVTIVFLGDYVDRGFQSRQVVERLMRGPWRDDEDVIPLLGNHDRLFAETWRDPEGPSAGTWAVNGGLATSASYGAPDFEGFPRLVPKAHIEFLEGLHLAVDDGERLYVHAGVRPGLGIEFQDEQDMTWIREPFLDEPHRIGRLVVHGHTIFKDGPSVRPWRLGIDSGAYGTGRLTGVRFDPGNPVPRVWQSGIGILPTIETPWVAKVPELQPR